VRAALGARHYNYFRDYDPRIGRYVKSDPLGLQAGLNTYGYVRGNPVSRIDRLGLVDIFVGGLGDRGTGIVKDFVPPGGQYFEHDQRREILEFIRRVPDGEPINLIGHSWGGDTAARVAIASCRTINSLITIDPVSWGRPDFDQVWSNVLSWTNVLASPTRDRGFSDFVADIGRQYGEGPRDFSNFISVDTVHKDFSGMMRAVQSSRNTP
jgi:RHS repeat-associated protein